MMTKEAYRNKVETKLKKSQAELEKLKARTSDVTGKARPEYEKTVDKIATTLKTAEQKFQKVKQAGGEAWQEHREGMQAALSDLQEAFNIFNQRVKTSRADSKGWPEGLANKEVVDSIGWAEGISEEDPVKSSGWAEGLATEKAVQSEGWSEGYDKDKKKA